MMTKIEKAQASCLGASYLLLVVGGLLVVVVSGGVVVVVVVVVGCWGSWLRGSVVWSQQSGMGKRGSKATMSTHPKYSQDLHQIYTNNRSVLKGKLYQWTGLQQC